ncbi:MAG: GTPase HflX [Candidatus Cloacimonadaceae bacterium]
MLEDDFDNFDELDPENQSEEWTEVSASDETAFLAALGMQADKPETLEAELSELERLADTAGITVLGKYYQRRNKQEKGTYFGKGWLQDISQKMKQAGASLLIVNDELAPMQTRNIEELFEIKVVDRTEVILNIFHNHAKTREAKLQVKLAELEYQLPRLRRMWEHFDKERGSVRSTGGTATRGMGEKQIEIDRRLIKREIGKINRILNQIMQQKTTQRKQREKTKKICLIGYTNAGKSTLFNALTKAGVLVEDKLFATLDSTTRQIKLDLGGTVVLSDTVGFISNLPHQLIASFKATLMEVQDADLLLHVVDSSDERFETYIDEVNKVLEEIDAQDIKQILILNKIDLLSASSISILRKRFPDAVLISAAKQENFDQLLDMIDATLFKAEKFSLLLPYSEARLVSRLHQTAQVLNEEYSETGIKLDVILSSEEKYLYEKFILPA